MLTTDDPQVLGYTAIIMNYFPGLEVITSCIAGQPRGVSTKLPKSKHGPSSGFSARDGRTVYRQLLSAAPLIHPAGQRSTDIPIIGAGSAAAHVALSLSASVAALGITEDVPAAMANVLGSALLASAKPVGETTVDLMKPPGKQAVLTAAKVLREKGAQASLGLYRDVNHQWRRIVGSLH